MFDNQDQYSSQRSSIHRKKDSKDVNKLLAILSPRGRNDEILLQAQSGRMKRGLMEVLKTQSNFKNQNVVQKRNNVQSNRAQKSEPHKFETIDHTQQTTPLQYSSFKNSEISKNSFLVSRYNQAPQQNTFRQQSMVVNQETNRMESRNVHGLRKHASIKSIKSINSKSSGSTVMQQMQGRQNSTILNYLTEHNSKLSQSRLQPKLEKKKSVKVMKKKKVSQAISGPGLTLSQSVSAIKRGGKYSKIESLASQRSMSCATVNQRANRFQSHQMPKNTVQNNIIKSQRPLMKTSRTISEANLKVKKIQSVKEGAKHRKSATSIPKKWEQTPVFSTIKKMPMSMSTVSKAQMESSYISSQNQNNSTGFLTQNDINIQYLKPQKSRNYKEEMDQLNQDLIETLREMDDTEDLSSRKEKDQIIDIRQNLNNSPKGSEQKQPTFQKSTPQDNVTAQTFSYEKRQQMKQLQMIQSQGRSSAPLDDVQHQKSIFPESNTYSKHTEKEEVLSDTKSLSKREYISTVERLDLNGSSHLGQTPVVSCLQIQKQYLNQNISQGQLSQNVLQPVTNHENCRNINLQTSTLDILKGLKTISSEGVSQSTSKNFAKQMRLANVEYNDYGSPCDSQSVQFQMGKKQFNPNQRVQFKSMNLQNINTKQRSPMVTPTVKALKNGKKKKSKSNQNKENIPIQEHMLTSSKKDQTIKPSYYDENFRNFEVINVRHLQVEAPHQPQPNYQQFQEENSNQIPLQSNVNFQNQPDYDQNIEQLNNDLNNISAISQNELQRSPSRVEIRPVSSELLTKIKTLFLQNTMSIIWNDIENIFINVENPKSLPNSTIKAGKALCYGLQVFIQDPKYETHKALSKIAFMQTYLLKHQVFILNLTENVLQVIEKGHFESELQSKFIEQLKTVIFGKLLDEYKNKNETKLLQSPRVRNTECKQFFSFAYFIMLFTIEFEKLQANAQNNSVTQASQNSSFKQYRSSVANKICMTLKNKYNKDLSIRGTSENNRTRNDQTANSSFNNNFGLKEQNSENNSNYQIPLQTSIQNMSNQNSQYNYQGQHFIGDDYNDSKSQSQNQTNYKQITPTLMSPEVCKGDLNDSKYSNMTQGRNQELLEPSDDGQDAQQEHSNQNFQRDISQSNDMICSPEEEMDGVAAPSEHLQSQEQELTFNEHTQQTEQSVDEEFSKTSQSIAQSQQSSCLNSSKIYQNPAIPKNSVRNVSQIVETTQNFIQTMDSCTKYDVSAPFFHQKRGGIRVEDLINQFKKESKFSTMSKSKSKKSKKTVPVQEFSTALNIEIKTAPNQSSMDESLNLDKINLTTPNYDPSKCAIDQQFSAHTPNTRLLMEHTQFSIQNSKSNDLYSPNKSDENIQVVKIPNSVNENGFLQTESSNDQRLVSEPTTYEGSQTQRISQGQGQQGSTNSISCRQNAYHQVQLSKDTKSKDTLESKESQIQIQSNLENPFDGIGLTFEKQMTFEPSHDGNAQYQNGFSKINISDRPKQMSMSARECKEYISQLNQVQNVYIRNETSPGVCSGQDIDQSNMMEQFGIQPVTARVEFKPVEKKASSKQMNIIQEDLLEQTSHAIDLASGHEQPPMFVQASGRSSANRNYEDVKEQTKENYSTNASLSHSQGIRRSEDSNEVQNLYSGEYQDSLNRHHDNSSQKVQQIRKDASNNSISSHTTFNKICGDHLIVQNDQEDFESYEPYSAATQDPMAKSMTGLSEKLGIYGCKTPRVLVLSSSDNSGIETTQIVNQKVQVLNDQSPVHILYSQNSGPYNTSQINSRQLSGHPSFPNSGQKVKKQEVEVQPEELKMTSDENQLVESSSNIKRRQRSRNTNDNTQEDQLQAIINDQDNGHPIKGTILTNEYNPIHSYINIQGQQEEQEICQSNDIEGGQRKSVEDYEREYTLKSRELHQIIKNLENLKRERANSGDRRTSSHLKRLTEQIISDQMSQLNIDQISQTQGGNEMNVRQFDMPADQELQKDQNYQTTTSSINCQQPMTEKPQIVSPKIRSIDKQISEPIVSKFQYPIGKSPRMSSIEKYSDIKSINKQKQLDQQVLIRSKELILDSGNQF